jgi:membrane protein DedA with SNARE-associated domain
MSVEELIQQHGYPIILLGTVFEGQPVMLFGGFAAHRGYLELLPWVVLAGAVGNFLGIQAWFLVGRRFGQTLLERRPHWAGRIAKAQSWLDRFDAALIVGIRFMPGFATVGALAIAMANVSIARFTALNAFGSLLWATMLATAGYLLGDLLELVLGDLERVEKPLLIGVVLVALLWIVHRHLKDHLWRGVRSPGGSAP